MANSIYEATGDGSTTDFTIPYTYLEADDVTAFVGGVSTSFTFTSDNVVTFASAPANGVSVRILRNTDVDALNVTYSDGGALTAQQLNDSNRQLLFGVQEAIDTANEAMILDNDGKFNSQVDGTNRVIKNIADPVSSNDATNKAYVDQIEIDATAAKVAAEAAQAAAETAETNAAASAATATTKASEASTSASNAATSASNSATSASSSSTSATASAASASAASASQSAAATSASNASTSESNAAASASSASTSAATATTQAGIATTKAGEASTSASNAATSESNAASSASAAASSASSASSAQTAAESARDATLAAYDSFDDRYLGVKSSDPTVDNDGDALVAGSLYFNSVSESMKIYTGSAWVAAYVSGTDFLALAGGTMTGDVTYGDGVKAKFGAGSDLSIYHNGTHSFIAETNAGGNLYIDAETLYLRDATGDTWLRGVANDRVELYHNSSEKLRTTSGGIDVTGQITADKLVIQDDGSSSPLVHIKSDDQNPHALIISNDTYSTTSGVGYTVYQDNGGAFFTQVKGDGAYENYTIGQHDGTTQRNMLRLQNDGSVRVYYGGTEKVATTSYGLDVSGSVVADTQTTTGVTGSQTPDMSSYQNFVWTLSGNITLANPTTEKVGQTGFFVFIHSGAARTVSLGTQYRTVGGAGLTLSSTVGAVDFVPYAVRASGIINLGTPQLGFA